MCANCPATLQVPRTIQVELWRDLTSSCMVGDVVVVTGVVKVLASGDDLSKCPSVHYLWYQLL